MRFVFLFFTTVCCAVLICLQTVVSLATPITSSQDTALAVAYDVSPQFPGGMANWQKFLQKNFNVHRISSTMDSASYVNYGLRQRAQLEFTVCEDGEVCDVEVTNRSEVSPEFVRETLRLMKRSPKWLPATADGKPVRIRFVQSISLVLPE